MLPQIVEKPKVKKRRRRNALNNEKRKRLVNCERRKWRTKR